MVRIWKVMPSDAVQQWVFQVGCEVRWRWRHTAAHVHVPVRVHLEGCRHFVLHSVRTRHKLVHKLLTEHLLNDVLVVVVAKGSTQFVVVHVVLIFPQTPKPSHLLGVDELELAFIVCPCDDLLVLLQSKKAFSQSKNSCVEEFKELTCWFRSNSSKNCHRVMLVSIPGEDE